MTTESPLGVGTPAVLSARARYIVLAAAFLGWMCGGIELGMYLAARPAITDILTRERDADSRAAAVPAAQSLSDSELEQQVGKYASWYICAFLLGAALGGWLFGWLGDYLGRAKTMGMSILCYSLLTGAAYYAQTVDQFLVLRFLACLGVGGMWPVGVSLASEAWSNASRPLLAGLIGTAANVGLVFLGLIGRWEGVSPDHWRWLMIVGGSPIVLGVLVLMFVPESPAWLAHRERARATQSGVPMTTVFRPPYVHLTILGIVLGTIPLLGGWGSVNWIVLWADKVGTRLEDAGLAATTQTLRSAGAALGSLMGGWMASRFGRRSTYFAVSLLSLLSSGYIFWFLTPESRGFFVWTFVLGFAATIYFGWLPLYLPELFPTRVRATGSGVTFNFGRILSAVGVLGAGWLLGFFDGNYAHTGRVTHLIFAIGMIVILFAPDTSQRQMAE